jgi:hypothetical protein
VGYGGHTPHHHGQQKAVYRLRHQDMFLFFKWSVTVVRFVDAKLVKTEQNAKEKAMQNVK